VRREVLPKAIPGGLRGFSLSDKLMLERFVGGRNPNNVRTWETWARSRPFTTNSETGVDSCGPFFTTNSETGVDGSGHPCARVLSVAGL